MHAVEFDQDWPQYFQRLDGELKERVSKKINKVLEYPQKRHLKSIPCFVVEVGQYRIVYQVFEECKTVKFYFVGNHKEYEKWYKE
jgi:mRNA-degrading endonuclease RelE of RelBE toxin-antitoxin system